MVNPARKVRPRVGHAPEGPHGRVLLHRSERAAVVRAAQEQVDLHVHQPGQQRDVAQVDHLGVVGDRRGGDLDDALAEHEEVPGLDHLAADDVEQARAAHVDRAVRGARARHGAPSIRRYRFARTGLPYSNRCRD